VNKRLHPVSISGISANTRICENVTYPYPPAEFVLVKAGVRFVGKSTANGVTSTVDTTPTSDTYIPGLWTHIDLCTACVAFYPIPVG
jgi:hypothetical protein